MIAHRGVPLFGNNPPVSEFYDAVGFVYHSGDEGLRELLHYSLRPFLRAAAVESISAQNSAARSLPVRICFRQPARRWASASRKLCNSSSFCCVSTSVVTAMARTHRHGSCPCRHT